MRKILRGVLILLLNIPVQRLEARTLKVALGLSHPPYIYQENGLWRGLEVDIVTEALKRLGHQYKIESLSGLRLEAEALHGKSYDIVFGLPQKKSSGSTFYSEAYLTFDNQIVSLRANNLHIDKVGDLKHLRLGLMLNVWKGFSDQFRIIGPKNENEYSSASYRQFKTSEAQCLSFWQNEFDALLVDRYAFNWFRISLAHRVNTSQSVRVHSSIRISSSAYAAFLDRQLQVGFNHVLQKMRESGDLERMRKNYLDAQVIP